MYSKISMSCKIKRGACVPRFVILIFITLLTGCLKQSPSESDLFRKVVVKDNIAIPLVAHLKKSGKANTLRVYLEGDGYAWQNRTTPSKNPTPRSHSMLKMAMQDKYSDILYIARPCQYLQHDIACQAKYWTYARYSEAVINSIHTVISKYENYYSDIELIGYSGGANIAGTLAVLKQNIKGYITIAGNLDHKAWTDYHGVSYLSESTNSADHIQQLCKINQIHFFGAKDKVIPPQLIEQYENMLNSNTAKFIKIQQQGHGKWERIWPQLLAQHLN